MDTLRLQLTEALTGRPGIVAAWVYGSRARGTHRPDSDVDVAVLFERPPRGLAPERFDLEDELRASTGLEVHLVPVNAAPADLVHRVLRDGVLLVDRDRRRRIAFEVRMRNEYFDMSPIWRRTRRLPPGTAP